MQNNINRLKSFLPELAAPRIASWIDQSGCEFRISKKRTSKFGDYRAPFKGKGHRISVNNDLNPFAFLVTTVHEFAHLQTWQQYGNKVKPHGLEWKENFRILMTPFMTNDFFPEELLQILHDYMANPAASSCTDPKLFKALKRYDKPRAGLLLIEEIPEGALFKIENGRVFLKKEKRRTRYTCVEVATQRVYLFSSVAIVLPITENHYISTL